MLQRGVAAIQSRRRLKIEAILSLIVTKANHSVPSGCYTLVVEMRRAHYLGLLRPVVRLFLNRRRTPNAAVYFCCTRSGKRRREGSGRGSGGMS